MHRRGSILATVVVIAAVMFLLTGVVYTYFRMNSNTAVFRMSRIRAETAAESGIALAIHYLSAMETMPNDGQPFTLDMEGDSSGWIQIPYGGRCFIVIDPVNGSVSANSNGAVEIRSRGISGSITRDIYARAAPAYPTSYALLTSEGIPEGFFIDGRVVNGPVHSNGIITFSSYSSDSTGDPYVDMISTTSQGGFFFTSGGRSEVPHPEGSNIWIRPYNRLRQGNPFWRLFDPVIDFSRMGDYFRSLSFGTIQHDALRIDCERILIEGQRAVYKSSETGTETAVDISDISLLVIRNGFSPVMLKCISRPDHPITIVAPNDLLIGGPIDGGSVGSGGPMGLVSIGDIIIPADPDLTGGSDWPGRWQIETDRGFMIRASMVIPYGSFRAQQPYIPQDIQRITIYGGLTQSEMGRLSSANSGYQLGISWDQGLGALHPPYFPLLGRWNIYSWLIDPPEQGDTNMEDDLV